MKLVDYEVKRHAFYLECDCGGEYIAGKEPLFGMQKHKCDKCSKTIKIKYKFPELAYYERKPNTKKVIKEDFS